jgi:hypothetical protein
VRALERDSQVEIREWNVGNQFVPLYWVRWIQPFARRGNFLMPIKSTDIVASIELVEPEHLLLQMHVEKPQYINRHRLVVPNREELLQQTDNPQLREMWFTTKAYKAAALQAMLSDVNRVCTDLHLPEKLPVETGDLTEIRIETPFFSDHQHRFATICTSNYVYAANIGNKLCYINKNFREQDESRFLLGIKSRYTASMSEANTLQAYVIATQWLASASIDVAALGRDCHVESTPWSLDKNQCVPLYTFRWIRGQEEEIATVEVLEPERLLLKLWVENADYIKRRSLALPNRESLLAQTNAPLSHAQ